MHTCRGIVIAAVLTAGCSGSIDSPYKPVNGSGASPGTGAGPNGTAGSAAGNNPGAGGSSNTAGSSSTAGNGSGNNTSSGGSGAQPSGGTSGVATCVPGVPGTSQLPRLTNAQYQNTVRDLFQIGVTTDVLAPDSVGSVDERTWQGYKDAADAVTAAVMADPAAKSRVLTCATADATCFAQIVEQFGARAFRRQLTQEEKDRFKALTDAGAEITETGTFDEIAALLIKAVLISPSFLTRGELNQATEPANPALFSLTSYEVASRLSYMLWDSMPDQPLFDAAAADTLTTREGILAQATRMLGHEKARAKVGSFHQQYMHMAGSTRWADVQRDTARYPLFTPTMVPMLAESTARFFDYVVFDLQGTFQDIITKPQAFVNATLAPFYGLNAAEYGADYALANLDANRAGVFTQVGFLTVNAAFGRTSPILRGAFIQEEILCAELGAPPADAQSAPIPTDGATNRENTESLTAGPTCIGCHHTYINPIGFALESYDAVGKWQTNEVDTGAAIDTNALVTLGSTEVNVTGAVDLMAALAASPEAQRCYAKKWVQYAYQRSLTSQDACTVNEMTGKLTAGGYTVINLLTDLTQTDTFRTRAQEVAQ
jgi:hypothetical protein